MTNALATLSSINTALAAIQSVPDAKDLRDKAAAICRYAKESRQSLEIQNRAAYVKLLCERKAGSLLLEVPRANGKRMKGDGVTAMLAASGIPESTARRWQYLAQWPEDHLIALLEVCNEDEDELTTAMAVASARAYLGSLKEGPEEDEPAAEHEATDEQPEDEPEQFNEQEWADEPAYDEQEEAPAAPAKPRVDPARIANARQLLDALTGICTGVPEFRSWVATIEKWQAKLNKLERE